ncbi:IS66 family transposase [Solimonas terrae]|uniref:Transposase n=1 Tax=Solimonas terrae TaxID=1396819 RepID=A0A6M2BT11_9GAMM|nr:transposase [Solimonas terrae]
MEAITGIGALYRIEDAISALDVQAKQAWRQQHAAPHLATFKDWLIHLQQSTLRQRDLTKAIDYTPRRWAALTRYLDDGRYPTDNNPIESAIWPIALGRKNRLFAGSKSAGRRAAAIMCMIAAA